MARCFEREVQLLGLPSSFASADVSAEKSQSQLSSHIERLERAAFRAALRTLLFPSPAPPSPSVPATSTAATSPLSSRDTSAAAVGLSSAAIAQCVLEVLEENLRAASVASAASHSPNSQGQFLLQQIEALVQRFKAPSASSRNQSS